VRREVKSGVTSRSRRSWLDGNGQVVSSSQASCCFRMFCPRRGEAAAGVLKPCFGLRHCGLSGLLVSAVAKTFSEFCLEWRYEIKRVGVW
jgi:hypothetical protein